MKFEMPTPEELAQLSSAQIAELIAKAGAEFEELEATLGSGEVSADTVKAMEALNAAETALIAARDETAAAETARAEQARALADQRAADRAAREAAAAEAAANEGGEGGTGGTDGGDGGEGGEGDGGEGGDGGNTAVAEAEQIVTDAAADTAVSAAASGKRQFSFAGHGARTGRTPGSTARTMAAEHRVGFQMRPGVPGFVNGHVGFAELAASIDSMAVGRRIMPNRQAHRERSGMIPVSLATIDRGFTAAEMLDDPQLSAEEIDRRIAELVERTEYRGSQFTDEGALAASGGHCAVPETTYEFCGVTPATGLLTLPAANFGPRGGQRRPLEPDFTELYNTLPWRFTETELEATNPDGSPVVIKPCIEIPCVEWEEIYVEAIGLCVTSGILQRRGFPESIARFLAEVTKAHLIKVHKWSLIDMAADSTPWTVAAGALGAAGAFLNGLALRATIIRQRERLAHDAPIHGEAPAWMLEVARADMALQQGVEVKDITAQVVDRWLTARHIQIQWLSHWQELPEASVRWPTSAQVLLHPAGAWVQHLQPVIEVGTLHSKEMLQQNRQLEFFTEDEYKVDRRCLTSELVTVNLSVNGSVGARDSVTAATTTNEVQTVTISGGPTGGTFTLTFRGATTTALPYNASLAAVQAALAKLPTIGFANVAVTGGTPGASYVVRFQGVLGATDLPVMSAAHAFTGGTAPGIAVAQTTAGSPNTVAA